MAGSFCGGKPPATQVALTPRLRTGDNSILLLGIVKKYYHGFPDWPVPGSAADAAPGGRRRGRGRPV